MNTAITIINLLFYAQTVLGRDFYLGIFRRDDFLVAQDNVFKEKRPYSYVSADYGRLFKCPISYFRVVDRLGTGGPTVKIMRGGLNNKYIAVRINSQYNLPISVNIYVGCHNKRPRLPMRPIRRPTKTVRNTTTIGHKGKRTTEKHILSTAISNEKSEPQTKEDKNSDAEINSETTEATKTDLVINKSNMNDPKTNEILDVPTTPTTTVIPTTETTATEKPP